MISSKAGEITVPLKMNRESLLTFSDELDAAREEESVKVVILQGQAGAGAPFSIGLDLERMLAGDEWSMNLAQEVFEDLYRFPKPVISLVKGDAIAGGLIWVALADYVLASPGVHFSLPEATFGVAPYIVMTCLSERMSAQTIRHLCMSSEKITAERALLYHLVDELASAEMLDNRLKQLVKQYARAESSAVQRIKAFSRNDRSLRASCEKLEAQLRDEEVRFNVENYLDVLSLMSA